MYQNLPQRQSIVDKLFFQLHVCNRSQSKIYFSLWIMAKTCFKNTDLVYMFPFSLLYSYIILTHIQQYAHYLVTSLFTFEIIINISGLLNIHLCYCFNGGRIFHCNNIQKCLMYQCIIMFDQPISYW